LYEDRLTNESKYLKIKEFFNPNNTSWLIFGFIILVGIIIRFFLWDFTSSDIFVWKDAAEMFINGENPYEITLQSFQIDGMKHFYAYFPLWLYICSLIRLIFPETYFFGAIKGLILFYDLQIVLLLYTILQKKVNNPWRLKIPIAIWFITPMVLMTSSMHGKFDSLMFVFILLACISYEHDQFTFEAIFLILAILTKPIVLILVPFFFRKDILYRNFSKLFAKIFIMISIFVLFSIPFLNEPLIYLQGSLGVHITRDNDLGLIFALLSLPFSSDSADNIIRYILTALLVALWCFLIIYTYFKKIDIYKSAFLAFVVFNSLYWVFLIQYAVWIYTLYIIVGVKSRMKHWHLGVTTSAIILVSTIALIFLGAFVKHGL